MYAHEYYMLYDESIVLASRPFDLYTFDNNSNSTEYYNNNNNNMIHYKDARECEYCKSRYNNK